MSTTPKGYHTFDGRSWSLIKNFVGIYDIQMNYKKISKISNKKLYNACIKTAKLHRKHFEHSVQYVIKYDEYGKMHSEVCRGLYNKSNKEKNNIILKKIAQGHKNKQLYQALSKLS